MIAKLYKQCLADLMVAVPGKRWASGSSAARFYRNVGVKQMPLLLAPSKNNVDSPISAGVDGTQSASGIHHIPRKKRMNKNTNDNSDDSSSSSLLEMLEPRLPGEVWSNENANDKVDWWGVTLDDKLISTPMKQTLVVPSKTLAVMIAAEWDDQSSRGIQPSNMPFMTLACTALDQAVNHPQVYRDEAIRYLRSDTTCFWADPAEDRLLHRQQQQAWKGLHEFCTLRLGGSSPTTAIGLEGILMCRKRGTSKPHTGLPHPQSLIDSAIRWTRSLDAWQLIALNSIATQAKSFLIAFAILEGHAINLRSTNLMKSKSNDTTSNDDDSNNDNINDRDCIVCPFPDMSKAVAACRVEEELQISM